MPTPRPEKSSTGAIVMLFAAAALLALGGILLLLVDTGPSAPPADPEAAPSAPESPSSVSSTAPAEPAPRTTTAAEQDAPAPESLPPQAADTARRFVLAWTSHDARPGRDASFSDAGRRAAAYATEKLAGQLREPGDRSTRLWQQWLADETRVTCTVDRVATPDGAPAATATRAYVRLLYTCTARTAGRPDARTHDQLALEMRHGPAGPWRVAAIMNA